jgi:hypothetical protein
MIKQAVMVQKEEAGGKKTMWQAGTLQTEDVSGALNMSVTTLFNKWNLSMPVKQISSFQVLLVGDVQTLTMMYGGGLLPYLLALFMSRWVKIPVLEFKDQLSGVSVQVRAGGLQPRKATRTLALKLADFLQQKGYSGLIPNLNDETLWKFPWVPVLIGLGIFGVLLVTLCVLLAFVNT